LDSHILNVCTPLKRGICEVVLLVVSEILSSPALGLLDTLPRVPMCVTPLVVRRPLRVLGRPLVSPRYCWTGIARIALGLVLLDASLAPGGSAQAAAGRLVEVVQRLL